MSHFLTIVFSHTPEQVKGLMAPYEELWHVDSPLTVFEPDEEFPVDETMKQRGRWRNPNARWDGYVYDGWRTAVRLKEVKHGMVSASRGKRLIPEVGGYCDQALAADCELGFDQRKYNEALRYWSVIVEEAPIEEEEGIAAFRDALYYRTRYRSKEAFAKERAYHTPYAFITADGVWHAPGIMGFLGQDDATIESRERHVMEWKEAVQDAVERGLFLTVLDCHC